MKKINTIIIEDEKTNIDILQELTFQFCPSIHIVGAANNVEMGYLLINQHRPHLVFLDVELGDATGFDLLRKFKTSFFKTIFTTAYSHYAIDAFREQALDYLLKPINIMHLQEAVAKVEISIELEGSKTIKGAELLPQTKICLPTLEGFLFIDYNEILHCEASRSYSYVHLADGQKILVSMYLKEFEALLPDAIFYRVHNSHIININHIVRYIKGRIGQLVLKGNVVVEVSSSRRDQFLQSVRNIK